MLPVFNHLIQLQELLLIRTEQKTHRKGERTEELNAAVQELTRMLPPEVQLLIARMQARDPLLIVPVSNNICVGCGMKLPTSVVQTVRQAKQLQSCPVCSRILYIAEGAPKRIIKPMKPGEMPKFGIARFSNPKLVIPRLKALDRDGAIAELARQMQSEGFVDDADKLIESALKREAIVGTAVDHGIAFPHVRGVEGGGLVLALGITPKGVRFDQTGNNPTKIIFFAAIPTAASAFYLKLLAGLAETFHDVEARNLLMADESQDKVWKVLLKLTKKRIV
ncbi:MAG: PTS sugar transporter subunit IIA [bacterium]